MAFCFVPPLPPPAPWSTWEPLWAAAAAPPRPSPYRVCSGGRGVETGEGEPRSEPRPAAGGTTVASPAAATSPVPAPVVVGNNVGDDPTTSSMDSVHKGFSTAGRRSRERGCGRRGGGCCVGGGAGTGSRGRLRSLSSEGRRRYAGGVPRALTVCRSHSLGARGGDAGRRGCCQRPAPPPR